jgi:hypothetical protein
MTKITEQQLVEMSRNLRARLLEANDNKLSPNAPGAWGRFWAAPGHKMSPFSDYGNRYDDPNDTNGIEVKITNWGLQVGAGQFKGQTGAVKSQGEWYTLPDKTWINPNEKDAVTGKTATERNVILNLEKLAIAADGRDPKDYIKPGGLELGTGQTNTAVQNPDTNQVTLSPNQANNGPQIIRTPPNQTPNQNGNAARQDQPLGDAPAGVANGNYTVNGQKVTVKDGKYYARQ